jgi:hypothetical protein
VNAGRHPATFGVMAVQAISTGDTPLLVLQPLLAAAMGACGLLTLGPGHATTRARIARDGSATELEACGGLALAGAVFVWQMA